MPGALTPESVASMAVRIVCLLPSSMGGSPLAGAGRKGMVDSCVVQLLPHGLTWNQGARCRWLWLTDN